VQVVCFCVSSIKQLKFDESCKNMAHFLFDFDEFCLTV